MTEAEYTRNHIKFEQDLRALVSSAQLPMVAKLMVVKGLLGEMDAVIRQKMVQQEQKED